MEMLVGDRWVEINVGKMSVEIDTIFHREISSKTGVIIRHNDIVRFVADFIRESNKRELAIQHRMSVVDNEIENGDKQLKRLREKEGAMWCKIDKGKVVDNLDSIGNKIRYYFLGYILEGECFDMRRTNDNKHEEGD